MQSHHKECCNDEIVTKSTCVSLILVDGREFLSRVQGNPVREAPLQSVPFSDEYWFAPFSDEYWFVSAVR